MYNQLINYLTLLGRFKLTYLAAWFPRLRPRQVMLEYRSGYRSGPGKGRRNRYCNLEFGNRSVKLGRESDGAIGSRALLPIIEINLSPGIYLYAPESSHPILPAPLTTARPLHYCPPINPTQTKSTQTKPNQSRQAMATQPNPILPFPIYLRTRTSTSTSRAAWARAWVTFRLGRY